MNSKTLVWGLLSIWPLKVILTTFMAPKLMCGHLGFSSMNLWRGNHHAMNAGARQNSKFVFSNKLMVLLSNLISLRN
jgi:hypothetical protein